MRLPRPFATMFDAAAASIGRSFRVFWERWRKGSEDEVVTAYERTTLILKCRDALRNNPVAAGIVDRVANIVVGTGIHPEAQTLDPEWNAAAEAFWRDWARHPEAEGCSNLTDLLTVLAGNVVTEGGIFLIKHSDGSIEPVELDRLEAPQAERSVLDNRPYDTDRFGHITRWCVADTGATAAKFSDRPYRWIRAENALTLFDRKRADQVLPWPQLAPVLNTIQDLKELNDLTLLKAKAQASVAVVHKRGASGKGLQLQGRRELAAAEAEAKAAAQKLQDATGWALVDTDGDMNILANNTPGSTYDQFVRWNVQQIGMAIGLPYEFLLLFFGNSTYSSSKATLVQAHASIKRRQDALIEHILRPLWLWRIAMAVADGDLPPPPECPETGLPDYDHVSWRRPPFDWIDVSDAIDVEIKEVRAGFRTRSECCAKRGLDFEDVLRKSASEMAAIRRVAAEYGVDPANLSNTVLPGAAQ